MRCIDGVKSIIVYGDRDMRKHPNLFKTIILFFFCGVVFFSLASITEYSKYNRKRESVGEILVDLCEKMTIEIEDYYDYVYILESIVKSDPKIISNHNEIVMKGLYHNDAVIKCLQLAPKGYVRYVYPKEPNETILGMYVYESVGEDTIQKIKEGYTGIFIEGPLELEQGGVGVVCYKLVKDPKDSSSLWGTVAVVLDLNELLKSVNLNSILEHNYDYHLWYYDESLQEYITIEGGTESEDKNKDFLVKDMYLSNGTWRLGLMPKQGWVNKQSFYINYAIAVLGAIVFSMAFHLYVTNSDKRRMMVMNSMREKESLEIINSLCMEYYSVYRINFTKDEVLVLRLIGKTKDELVEINNRNISYIDSVFTNAEKIIHRDEMERYLVECASNYVCAQLKTRTNYSRTYRTNDGRYLEVKFVSIPSDGTDMMAVIGFSDVSKKVEDEKNHRARLQDALNQAENASKSKTDFLFNMSHDIRTPMNAIIGFNGMAKKHIEDKDLVLEYLDKVSYASSYMLELLNEILDMSRIECGKVRVELHPVHLPSEFMNIEEMFSQESEKRNIELISKIGVINNEFVMADGIKIKEVLINLLSNAFKYTNEGGKIWFSMRQIGRAKAGYGSFEFKVKDTGIGMSEEFQYRLFDAFERENNSTISGRDGVGLGLSICKSLVDMMQGVITCESELGSGTEFTVRIPLQTTTRSMVAKTIEHTPKIDFRGMRVLLAEDNELNSEIAVEVLEEMGFVVDTASDGEIAVRKLKEASSDYYDLILMDIQMPTMNGLEATKIIRGLKDEKKRQIPIVAMTANAFEEDRKKSIDAGMNEHMDKPIKMKTLYETLARVMS